jgi:hypothetical protein
MRFTSRARLETWAHASRVQSDEVTFDMKSELVCQVEELRRERDGCRAALFQAQQAAKALLAKGEMLAAVVQGAREDFVKVPYGASHEDVAALNDWHKMAAEALQEWERR